MTFFNISAKLTKEAIALPLALNLMYGKFLFSNKKIAYFKKLIISCLLVINTSFSCSGSFFFGTLKYLLFIFIFYFFIVYFNEYYIFYLDTKKIITADILKGVDGKPANTIIGSKNNIDFLFDTNKRKIVYTNKNISFPQTYIRDFRNKYVVVTDENDIRSLVSLENPQDVLITNIQKMDFPSYHTNFIVFFTNNKIMVYDINNFQKLLPVFADKEIHLSENSTGYLTSNGIYFLSNRTNALLLDRPLNPNYSNTYSNGFGYKDQDLDVEVYTNRYAETAYFFIRQTGKHAQNYDSIEEIPEDIRNRVYNLVFGNTTTPQQIQENFRKIYNRFFKN